jgi:hypothetical protein
VAQVGQRRRHFAGRSRVLVKQFRNDLASHRCRVSAQNAGKRCSGGAAPMVATRSGGRETQARQNRSLCAGPTPCKNRPLAASSLCGLPGNAARSGSPASPSAVFKKQRMAGGARLTKKSGPKGTLWNQSAIVFLMSWQQP